MLPEAVQKSGGHLIAFRGWGHGDDCGDVGEGFLRLTGSMMEGGEGGSRPRMLGERLEFRLKLLRGLVVPVELRERVPRKEVDVGHRRARLLQAGCECLQERERLGKLPAVVENPRFDVVREERPGIELVPQGASFRALSGSPRASATSASKACAEA